MHTQDDELRVGQIVRHPEQFGQTVVRVRGMLVAPADGLYLVDLARDPAESIVPEWESADRLPIDDPGLVDRVFGQVTPWVGGPFLYRDDAVMVATVRSGDQGLVLTGVRGLTLTRSGIEYPIGAPGETR